MYGSVGAPAEQSTGPPGPKQCDVAAKVANLWFYPTDRPSVGFPKRWQIGKIKENRVKLVSTPESTAPSLATNHLFLLDVSLCKTKAYKHARLDSNQQPTD